MLKQIKSLPRYIPAAYELISSSVALDPRGNKMHRVLRYSYNELMRIQDRFASEYGLPFTAKQATKKLIIYDANNDCRTWHTYALAYLKFSFKDLDDYRFKHLLAFRNLLINIYDILNRGTSKINTATSWTYIINTSPKQ
jgi:hypothetical protein